MNLAINSLVFMCMCCYSRALLAYLACFALPLSCFALPLSCFTLPFLVYSTLRLPHFVLPCHACCAYCALGHACSAFGHAYFAWRYYTNFTFEIGHQRHTLTWQIVFPKFEAIFTNRHKFGIHVAPLVAMFTTRITLFEKYKLQTSRTQNQSNL